MGSIPTRPTKNMKFIYPIKFSKHEIIENRNTPIHILSDVTIGDTSRGNACSMSIPGTNMIMTCTPHYFHFLKEYVGSYLYYRNNFDKDTKFIWMQNAGYTYPVYQDTRGLCSIISDHFSGSSNARLDYQDFSIGTFKIERLVLMLDSQKAIVDLSGSNTKYFDTPDINREIRKEFSRFGTKNHSPQKIFLTRSLVNKNLKRFPVKNESQKKWLDDQIRLRHIESDVEQAIEKVFVERGFSIIDPSVIGFHEQIGIFKSCSHFAGFLGTAFYNGIFSENGTNFTAIRMDDQYWYDFEGDIKSVIDCNFSYIQLYRKFSIDTMIDVIEKRLDEILEGEK